ncbi:MAG TPA: HD-GYP domain-containing protein [Methylophilaceae bacterium]|nr:HD-GYP domain-containing protein [Methylophilaceae bacterium]
MLKKISVEHLRVGMHLHAFCGSWMDHPFWRTQFIIEDPNDIQLVLASSVREVWINTDEGLDVEHAQPAEEADAKVAEALANGKVSDEVVERVSIQNEMDRAGKIVAKAKQAVTSMFQEVRMGRALDAQDALPLVEEISNSVMRNPGALISIARLKNKDEYTYMHSVAVCALMVSLARQLGMDEETTRKAGLAGLLHDVGKMAIPDEILNKPGKLTDEEFNVVRNHPVAGYDILLESKGMDTMVLDVCRHHHEKVDGGGYPDNFKGDHLSMYAKMGAVCDVYDAITSNRPYKEGWCPAESLRRMAEWCKYGQFDSRVFQAFVKSVGIYPIGTLVRLESGKLGVVIDQNEKSLLAPKVKVFYSIKSGTRLKPQVLDMSLAMTRDRIVSHEESGEWDIPDLHELWSGWTLPA